jgi:hypothetical protein
MSACHQRKLVARAQYERGLICCRGSADPRALRTSSTTAYRARPPRPHPCRWRPAKPAQQPTQRTQPHAAPCQYPQCPSMPRDSITVTKISCFATAAAVPLHNPAAHWTSATPWHGRSTCKRLAHDPRSSTPEQESNWQHKRATGHDHDPAGSTPQQTPQTKHVQTLRLLMAACTMGNGAESQLQV